MQTPTFVSGVQDPVLSINMWTHIVFVYGPKSGLRLFVSGPLYATPVSFDCTIEN
jgi:hypothetical protein